MGKIFSKRKPDYYNLQSSQLTKSRVELSKKVLKKFKLKITDLFVRNDKNVLQVYRLYNKPLGKGAYGEVKKAVHQKTGKQRAIKIINKHMVPEEDRKDLFNEIEILKDLDHPNIMKVYEYFETDSSYYIVTELLTGEHLYKKNFGNRMAFSEKDLKRIMRQLLLALKFIHGKGVLHGDIKNDNIMYDGEKIVLIDFGHSKRIKNKKDKRIIGTDQYLAPEVIKGSYNEKCDIWAAGVVFYICLTGQKMFSEENGQIYDNILNNQIPNEFEGADYVSRSAKDFLHSMLVYDYKQRPDADELLNHEWFSQLTYSQITTDIQIAMDNMIHYEFRNKLREIVYIFIVDKIIERTEIYDLLSVFETLDTNRNGFLTKDDFKRELTKRGIELSKNEVTDVFDQINKARNGKISFSEFLSASIDRKLVLSEINVHLAFKLFDENDNGRITLDEFNNTLQNHRDITFGEWRALLKINSTKRDSEITYEEFKKLAMKSLFKSRTRRV